MYSVEEVQTRIFIDVITSALNKISKLEKSNKEFKEEISTLQKRIIALENKVNISELSNRTGIQNNTDCIGYYVDRKGNKSLNPSNIIGLGLYHIKAGE